MSTLFKQKEKKFRDPVAGRERLLLLLKTHVIVYNRIEIFFFQIFCYFCLHGNRLRFGNGKISHLS